MGYCQLDPAQGEDQSFTRSPGSWLIFDTAGQVIPSVGGGGKKNACLMSIHRQDNGIKKELIENAREQTVTGSTLFARGGKHGSSSL